MISPTEIKERVLYLLRHVRSAVYRSDLIEYNRRISKTSDKKDLEAYLITYKQSINSIDLDALKPLFNDAVGYFKDKNDLYFNIALTFDILYKSTNDKKTNDDIEYITIQIEDISVGTADDDNDVTAHGFMPDIHILTINLDQSTFTNQFYDNCIVSDIKQVLHDIIAYAELSSTNCSVEVINEFVKHLTVRVGDKK